MNIGWRHADVKQAFLLVTGWRGLAEGFLELHDLADGFLDSWTHGQHKGKCTIKLLSVCIHWTQTDQFKTVNSTVFYSILQYSTVYSSTSDLHCELKLYSIPGMISLWTNGLYGLHWSFTDFVIWYLQRCVLPHLITWLILRCFIIICECIYVYKFRDLPIWK